MNANERKPLTGATLWNHHQRLTGGCEGDGLANTITGSSRRPRSFGSRDRGRAEVWIGCCASQRSMGRRTLHSGAHPHAARQLRAHRISRNGTLHWRDLRLPDDCIPSRGKWSRIRPSGAARRSASLIRFGHATRDFRVGNIRLGSARPRITSLGNLIR